MRTITQEAIVSAYIVSIGKRTPRDAAQGATELCKLANSLNRLNEIACNFGLTERQERRNQNLQTRIKAVLEQAGLVLNHDLPDGSYNSFGGRECGYGIGRRTMYDRVVTINNTHWPAYRKPGATLVDLRMFDRNDRSPEPRLVFRPEKLRELEIPEALIEAAAKSDPQGFLLFDDLPNQTQQATGLANKPQQPEWGGAICPRTRPTRRI